MIVRLDAPRSPDGGWHPEIIKAAIRVRGVTLTQLAKNAGLPEGTCRISLIRPHVEGDHVIASFLQVPLCELWPSRYDEDGNSIRHERDNTSRDRDDTHRLIVGAA